MPLSKNGYENLVAVNRAGLKVKLLEKIGRGLFGATCFLFDIGDHPVLYGLPVLVDHNRMTNSAASKDMP